MIKKKEIDCKMIKKVDKKWFISFIVLIMTVGVLAISASAYSATVYISQGQGPQYSGSIPSFNGANYSGSNYASSGHRLWVSLERHNGYLYETQERDLMNIGSSTSGFSTTQGNAAWRVKLNPELWYTDCDGIGTVSTRY